jgi:hypothetical protein
VKKEGDRNKKGRTRKWKKQDRKRTNEETKVK